MIGLFLCASAIAIDVGTVRCDAPIGAVHLEGVAPAGDATIGRDVLTYLLGQLDGKQVQCLSIGDHAADGAIVARCSVDGRDLGATLIAFGLARHP